MKSEQAGATYTLFVRCIVLIGLLCGVVGCQSTRPTPHPTPAETAPSKPIASDTVIGEDARSAAMLVSAMPDINDPSTEREVNLWSSLYRTAYQSNVGDFTKHYVLEQPPDDAVPALAIDKREFLLRVLAGLVNLNIPVTWAPPGRGAGMTEYYPGTRDRATRLKVRIIRRVEDQATVQAEVSDWTADVGSSRQAVTAVWDGEKWDIQRDRVRLVW